MKMLRRTQSQQLSKVIRNNRHELQNGRRGLSHAHDEVDEGIGGLAIFAEELVHDLGNND